MSSPSPTTPSPSEPSTATPDAPKVTTPPNDSDLTRTDEDLKRCLRDAEERKQEGTEHFRAARWTEALVMYRSALGLLPKRRPTPEEDPRRKGKARAESPDTDEEEEETDKDTPEGQSSDAVGDVAERPGLEMPPLEQECAKARAVLSANIGACHVKLGEHTEAVKACSDAIADDPVYIKAILRRAQSNEKIGSWSSLSSAQEDYTKLLELLPASSKDARDAERALRLLKPRVEAAQKQEVDEMLGKLKGLGNNILGKFGLSTDNFKFEPNGQGGYSMNFVR